MSQSSPLATAAVHTITTKQWDLPTACAKFSAAGIGGVGVWRQWLEGRTLAASRSILDDNGLKAVSLVRGGFFVAADATARKAAIDDNLRCLDEAAAIGAPQVVLVCGAVPGIPLQEARKQITDGIAACVDHARATGVQLAIEPLHPMYADSRSAVNTIGQANDIIDAIGGDAPVGIAADVYHIWWDPDLASSIAAAGKRIIGFHVCDWRTPTVDLLNDRGLMGEGCIDIRAIKHMVNSAGFDGFNEIEIFSDRWWAEDPDTFLAAITKAYDEHVA
jgi:sugar phosphate isomerase/epimerase